VYTRCPQCTTTFRITAAHLKSHGGQVRCGRCQHVFQADQHLVERPAKPAAKEPGTTRKRAPRKTSGTTSSPVTKPVPRSAIEKKPEITPEPASVEDTSDKAIADVDTGRAPLAARKTPLAATWLWSLGSIVLILALMVQGLIFYGHDMARAWPEIHPAVSWLCGPLPCRHVAFIDLQQLDLVESQVAPHPRYDRALRVRTTIVNRAATVQPYPRLEVSLIDSQGKLLARRIYMPNEYQPKKSTRTEGLLPQVAVSTQLDITSPGPQASGFEVLLLPPSE
jgi:predicted Zn finger-like uncharacterized protein